jgi:EpsI family protein
LTSNDYLAKLYSAGYQLLGRGDDSAVIVVYTSKNQTDDAEATLTSFLSSRYGAIDAALRAAADGRQK